MSSSRFVDRLLRRSSRQYADAALLAAIVESSDDAIVSKDLSGTITSWNRGAEAMFGYRADEIVGRHVSLLFPPDRAAEEEMIIGKIRQGQNVEHYETVRRRKDGRDFPVSLTVSPIRDGDGRIIGASKILRDITERKQAEAALVAIEERLRAIFEGAPNGLLVVAATGAIEMANVQAERLFGYGPGELPGRLLELLVPDRFRSDHPGLRASFMGENNARAMGAGRDLYGLKKDGTEFPVEIGLNPIRIGQNRLVLTSIVDISERKKAEDELRHSEERFRSIIDSVSEGIFISDAATGTFSDINEAGAAMCGWAAEELIGRTIESISSGVPPYTQVEAFGWIEKAAATGLPQLFEWQCKTKDGRLFWTDVSLRFASIAGRRVVLAIVRDVTERRAVEAQLQQAQKMEAIGQLTGGMAHDFNNLLAIIQGNLELIRERLTLDPAGLDMAEDAFRAATRGASLTHQLLAYSRRQPLTPVTVKIDIQVAEVARLLRRTLGETIDLRTVMPPDLWRTRIDPHQLENALLNLAVNARDAMPNGGRLTIEAANKLLDETYAEQNAEVTPGRYVLLAVTDSGTGMPKEVVDRVLEPFFTTKPVGKGSGLGLSMVYGFIKQSGGHMKIYSEVGRGTTINLYLPGVLDDGEIRASAPASGMVTAARPGETILVVEDEELVRKLALRVLAAQGYRTLEAADGPAALALLESAERIDLLLTDVVLPKGISGPEIARRTRASRPELKILYMSGYARDAALQNGELDGDVHLLTKPFPKDDLARKIRELLDGGGAP